MFAEILTAPEKKALLELLAYLSVLDGEVLREEVAFIATTAENMEVDAGDLFQGIKGRTLQSICAPLKRRKAKGIALLELINIGLADGHYDEAEQRGIRTIAEILGVKATLVENLESWVERGHTWQEEGKTLLGIK